MELAEIFDYDPATGIIRWREKPLHLFKRPSRHQAVNTRCAGKEAGYRSHKPDGKPHAITVEFFGRRMVAHHIAWHLSGRTVPHGMMIDHINQNPFDNRLENLRLADRRQNAVNSRLRYGKYGVPGVALHPGRPKPWSAKVRTRDGMKRLGYFPTKGLAALAYIKAKMRFGDGYFKP